MAASATDKFLEVGIPGTATNLAGSGYTIGATSITVDTTSGWPTASLVVFGMDVVETDADGKEVRVEGSYCIFEGIVTSGTTIGSVDKLFGTDQNYSAGASTRVYITISTQQTQKLIDGLMVAHNRDGSLLPAAVDAAILAGSIDTAQLADAAVTNAKLIAGAPVQMVSSSFTSVATGTGQIPLDDTVPQNTEGDEYMTLAFTPKSATNILVITIDFYGSFSQSAIDLIVALFQDSTASALAAGSATPGGTNYRTPVPLTHRMVAGTTSATTFKVRAGGAGAGTTTFNGAASGRYFGAITKSSITITEYKA